jgi:energy-coupling factor transporter transmembrane protein EcfT
LVIFIYLLVFFIRHRQCLCLLSLWSFSTLVLRVSKVFRVSEFRASSRFWSSSLRFVGFVRGSFYKKCTQNNFVQLKRCCNVYLRTIKMES